MKFKTISSISELKKEKNDARNFWKEELHESYSKKVPQTDKIISSTNAFVFDSFTITTSPTLKFILIP